MNPKTANAQSENIDYLLRTGIAAAKAGERERARGLLTRVVEQDEKNTMAWLWLSGVVNSLDDREVCLENVLTLDPGNDMARKGLDWVRKQKQSQSPPPVEAATTFASPSTPPLNALAGAGKSVAPALAMQPLAPAAVLAPGYDSAATWDGFGDEYRCPYCAAETLPEDRKCNICDGELWMKKRKLEQRSTALWIMMIYQALSTVVAAVIPLAALFLVSFQVRIRDPFALLPAYFGLPTTLPPDVVREALTQLPPHLFFALSVPFLISLGILVGLYMRWRPIFWLFVGNALLEVVLAFASWSLAERAGLCSGGFGVIWALFGFYLIFRIEDDFYFESRRIALLVDRDAVHASALLDRGNRYAKRKMWALATIHWRKACGMLPDRLDCRLALAASYIKLKQYGLAQTYLAEARRIRPDSPAVEELTELLNKSQLGQV